MSQLLDTGAIAHPSRGDHASVDEDVGAEIGHRVTRSYAVTVVRLVLGQLIAGVAFVLLSRHLAPSSYALYAAVAVAAPSLYYLLGTPLTNVLVRRQTPLLRGEVNAATTVLVGCVAVIGVAGAAATHFAVGWHLPLLVSAAVYVVGLSLCFPTYLVLSRNVRTGSVAMIDFTDRATFQVATVAAILVGATVQSALAIALGVTTVAVMAASQALYPWRLRARSPRVIAPELRSASWPALATAAAMLSDAILVPLVGGLAGAHQAGLFGWSFAVCAVPLGFVAAVIQVMYPALSRIADEQLASAVAIATRMSVLVAITLSAGIAVILPPLVPVIFPRWGAAVHVLWLLLGALSLYATASVLVTLWTARVSLRTAAIWQTTALAVSIALAVPLTLRYGAVGCAEGYLGGRLVLATLFVTGGRRKLGYRPPWTAIAWIGVALVAVTTGIAVEHTLGGATAKILVGALVTIVVLSAGIAATSWTVLRADLATGLALFKRPAA